MKNSVTKIALALVAMISMTGCPSKKKSNQFYGGYGYNAAYCQTANCYGTVSGYPQMFATGLGKIQTTDLHAEVAVSIQTINQVSSFTMNSWSGNTRFSGVMNVYSVRYCQIPPGQYQIEGTGNFYGPGTMSSFTGTMNAYGPYGSFQIYFPNNFISAITTTSVMGPSFPFAIQNNVFVSAPGCGEFVME